MEQTYKNCQSCGMPFKNDPKGGGTNADGTLNHKYCSYCYEKGRFTQPDITVGEMQQFVRGKLNQLGIFHRLLGGFFIKGIPRLERWNDRLKESKPVK
jgi:hypothetical protein